MTTLDKIKKQVSENPIIIYMKGTPDMPMCGFSSRTVDALKKCGKEFAYVNVILDQEVMQDLPKFKDWPTFPQLYIKGELIGGCDITLDLFESGELKKMIDEAKVEKVKTKEAAKPKKEVKSETRTRLYVEEVKTKEVAEPKK